MALREGSYALRDSKGNAKSHSFSGADIARMKRNAKRGDGFDLERLKKHGLWKEPKTAKVSAIKAAMPSLGIAKGKTPVAHRSIRDRLKRRAGVLKAMKTIRAAGVAVSVSGRSGHPMLGRRNRHYKRDNRGRFAGS